MSSNEKIMGYLTYLIEQNKETQQEIDKLKKQNTELNSKIDLLTRALGIQENNSFQELPNDVKR